LGAEFMVKHVVDDHRVTSSSEFKMLVGQPP
jgi:hypothetical protein